MPYTYNPLLDAGLDQTGSGGSATTPGGSNTQLQFNDSGSFGGDADLTYNKTTNALTIGGDVTLNDGGSFTTTLQTITPTANRTVSLPDATGTVALVAGSSGQLLWNNAGANAGASTLTYDGSILTTSGRFINSYNATASSPAKAFTGTWFTGGTATTTKPQVLIEPTGTTSTAWSTSGTGLGVNAASGFAGNLLDLQVNGSTRAIIDSTGRFYTSGSLPTFFSGNPGVCSNGTGSDNRSFIAVARYNSGNVYSGGFVCLRSRSGTIGSHTIVQNNDVLGGFACLGSNGTTFEAAASFDVLVDGTPSSTSMPGRLVLSTTPSGTLSNVERLRITNDGIVGYNQPAPAAVDATATLTIANLKAGIITSSTASAVTMTLPTGTLTEGGFSGLYSNFTFEWSVINTGATNAITVQGGTDHTLVGSGTIAAGVSGRFASRRTAANTFVTYRLS